MTSLVRRRARAHHAIGAVRARCLAGLGVAKRMDITRITTKNDATHGIDTRGNATGSDPNRSIATKSNGTTRRRDREAGMTTAEYAIGTVAACSFAALLIAIVRSPEIKAALLNVITGALGLGG